MTMADRTATRCFSSSPTSAPGSAHGVVAAPPHDALDHLAATSAPMAHQQPGAALLRCFDGEEARYYAEIGDLGRARSVLDNLRSGRPGPCSRPASRCSRATAMP